jgi:acetyltransferase-like isoleucine patch superfamily enzyme
MKENNPFRPVSLWLRIPRAAARYLRNRYLMLRSGNRLKLGRNVVFGPGSYILSPDFARFGNNVAVGAFFQLEQNLQVGDDVLISSHVTVIGNDHPFDDPSHTVYSAPRNPASTVIIEGDNLIGLGVTIIGNVRIGKGCIIGARSVVTRDMPPYTVCYGMPARPVRERFPKRKPV